MIEQKSAAEISRYGYSHWTGEPTTPGRHVPCFIPQTIADGWEVYCSCGEYRCFISMYEAGDRDATIAKLQERFNLHRSPKPEEQT